jgi:hypothetical protein
MRAGREEYALLRWDERAASKPACGRVAVHRRSAEALVTEQRVEICGDARKPRPHPLKQLQITRLGGMFIVKSARERWGRIASPRRADERKCRGRPRIDETALRPRHSRARHW